MFGCLRRVLFLIVLLVVGVVAALTRDRWLPLLPGDRARTAAAPDSAATRADTGWVRVTYSAAERGRTALGRLRSAKGPALVQLAPAEFAALVLDSLGARLPASADSLAVRVEGRELQVRMSVRLGDLGGSAVLGPLAGMLGDRERLVIGGTLDGASAGRALLRPTSVRVGEFDVPGPVIPRLVGTLRRGAEPVGEAGTLALTLPPGVGDVRVGAGKVTLYRPVP